MLHSTNKYLVSSFILLSLTTGCASFSQSDRDSMTGPIGQVMEVKKPTLHLELPPRDFFQLEKSAGLLFQFIQNENWPDAETELQLLKTTWLGLSKTVVTNNRSIQKTEEKLVAFSHSIQDKNVTQAIENLNQFMGTISDISKDYQLSPLTDIISLGNSLRNLHFYANTKDWSHLSKKHTELKNIWHNAKPGLEQLGSIGESTKIHATITRLNDAIESENSDQVNEELQKLNASLSFLRSYYYAK